MLEALLTEQRNPASLAIDELPTLEMLRVIHQEDRLAVAAVEPALKRIAEAVDAVAAAMNAGGRLFYIGAGTSGRLGVLDASECPPTFGVAPELVQGIISGGEAALSRATEASEDDPVSGARDLAARGFQPVDVLAGIAASGRTPYVLGAIRAANGAGAVTLGISCVPDSPLQELAKIPITLLTGPEVVTGSTRMKAGTATKLVLNMITTGAFIRRGYVFGNLMVNVQPRNTKLVDRATRIIMDAGCVDRVRAEQLLQDSGLSVPVAVVMARTGDSRDGAAAALKRANGRIADVLRLWTSS